MGDTVPNVYQVLSYESGLQVALCDKWQVLMIESEDVSDGGILQISATCLADVKVDIYVRSSSMHATLLIMSDSNGIVYPTVHLTNRYQMLPRTSPIISMRHTLRLYDDMGYMIKKMLTATTQHFMKLRTNLGGCRFMKAWLVKSTSDVYATSHVKCRWNRTSGKIELYARDMFNVSSCQRHDTGYYLDIDNQYGPYMGDTQCKGLIEAERTDINVTFGLNHAREQYLGQMRNMLVINIAPLTAGTTVVFSDGDLIAEVKLMVQSRDVLHAVDWQHGLERTNMLGNVRFV